MKIYHNPRCTKSRQTLALLRENGVEPEVVEYLKTPPTARELDSILKALNLQPADLCRPREAKELGLDLKTMSRRQAIDALVQNPRLIERPIVVSGQQAVLGRPPETVLSLL